MIQKGSQFVFKDNGYRSHVGFITDTGYLTFGDFVSGDVLFPKQGIKFLTLGNSNHLINKRCVNTADWDSGDKFGRTGVFKL